MSRAIARVAVLPTLLFLASACSPAREFSAPAEPDLEMAAEPAMDSYAAGAAQSGAQAPAPPADALAPPAEEGGVPPSNLRVIKDATMTVVVDRIESGLSRIETIAAQGGGYVVEKQTDFTDAYHRRATVKIAVRAEQFEASMERVRQAAEAVDQEQASGVDVSQQYVDLESEIANLEATRERIRSFLDDAESVEEALQVNAQLTSIEGEIGLRKGRLKDLADRSAYSSILISLSELPPAITPTVTATATATPTATPGPPWQPGDEVKEAYGVLGNVLRGLANLAIWVVVVLAPIALILALTFKALAWLVGLLRRRPPTPPPTSPPAP